MKKIGKILKGSVFAVFMAVMLVSPAFAACTDSDLSKMYPGLSTTKTSEHTIKCNGLITIGTNQKAVYGKTTNDCAQFGAISTKADWCQNSDLTAIVRTIINTIIFIVGILAVVMIVIGGINYALSQGDPGKVKKAKDTILYGVIGLVVALLAFAIVTFVLQALAQ